MDTILNNQDSRDAQASFYDSIDMKSVVSAVNLRPMGLSSINKPFDSADYIFEPLLDGIRVIATVENHSVRFRDKNLNDVTGYCPELSTIFRNIQDKGVVLDGVIVSPDHDGMPDFQRLGCRLGVTEKKSMPGLMKEFPLIYHAFDVLYINGKSVMTIPQWKRKDLLSQLVEDSDIIKVQDYIEEFGVSFFETIRDNNDIGIVAKNMLSIYSPGVVSNDWLRLGLSKAGDFVVGGYTIGGSSWRSSKSPSIASLLLGAYDYSGQLVYVGEVFTGFSPKSDRLLCELLYKQNSQSSFVNCPDSPRLTFWCDPSVVCRVKYGEKSRDGVMRFSQFVSLRPDLRVDHCFLDKEFV